MRFFRKYMLQCQKKMNISKVNAKSVSPKPRGIYVFREILSKTLKSCSKTAIMCPIFKNIENLNRLHLDPRLEFAMHAVGVQTLWLPKQTSTSTFSTSPKSTSIILTVSA